MNGSCLCGRIGYEIDQLDGPIAHCHCNTCRKAHAAAFASTARVDRQHFRWVRGAELISSYESSAGKQRHFCSACGSHLLAERSGQGHVILRVATLDEGPGLRPAQHIWCSHDVIWLRDTEATESFDEWPPGR